MNCLCECICNIFMGPKRIPAAPDPLVNGAPRTYGGEGYSSPLTVDAYHVTYPEVPTAAVKGYVQDSIAYTRSCNPTEMVTNQPFSDGERLADRRVRLPIWFTDWVQNLGTLFIEDTMKPPLALPQYSYSEIDVNSVIDRERLRIARELYGNESLGI